MAWDDKCSPQTEECQNTYCSPRENYLVFYIYWISVVRFVLFLKILQLSVSPTMIRKKCLIHRNGVAM
jgi:hypothetical protein